MNEPSDKEKPPLFPGGITWVAREYDPRFAKKVRFARTKAVCLWFKENVLAVVISTVIASILTTILVFYTTQLLTQRQGQDHSTTPTTSPAKQ